MKSSKELLELRDSKKLEAKQLAEKFDNTALTDEQRTQVDNLLAEIETLNGDIERAKRMEELTKIEAKKAANFAGAPAEQGEARELDKIAGDYAFNAAVRAAFEGGRPDGVIREMHEEGLREMSKVGVSTKSNSILVPSSILKRANVTENTTTGVVTTDFVQSVYAKTILRDLGATFISSVQDSRVPIIGTVSTQWEGEVDAAADGGSATTKVDLTPKRLASYVNYSKQAALQSNYSVENALRQAMMMAIASKLEYATFTDDSGNGAFNYIGNGKTQAGGTSNTAWLLVEAVVEEVLGNNHLQGNLGFAITHQLWSLFHSAVQVTGVKALVENDRIMGYPVRFSTQIADIASGKESVYFGDWSKLWTAQFGAIEILVDPYSVSTSGMDRLVLNSFWDQALIQDAAISVDGYDG